jgi:hypothetical protein
MAFVITIERFREIYPEFDSVPDAEVEYALELAKEIHGCSANAIYALTAHFLALASVEGGDGSSPSTGVLKDVKKSKVGRVTTEYVSMAGNMEDSFYETTMYGRRYLALSTARLKKFCTRVL